MYPILLRLPESLPWIGGWPLRSFSVMVLLGVLAAAWWLNRVLRSQGVTTEGAIDHMLRNALLVGFLGARVTYLIVHPSAYQNIISLIAVWQGGIVSYGGFFGGALGAWFFARAWRIPYARLGDAALPALFLGQVFGRIGCLLVGDDHGAPWDGPWAITFPDPLPEGSQFDPSLVGVPVHPSQVYMSLMNLVLFLTCIGLYPRRRFDGQIMGIGMVLYAIGRFGVEYTRGDDFARGYYGALSTAQWVSLVTLGLGLFVLWKQRGAEVTHGATPPARLVQAQERAGRAAGKP